MTHGSRGLEQHAAAGVTAVVFLILFWSPLTTLLGDWWSDPEAGHGLLLAPLALWLCWRRGIVRDPRPQPVHGLLILSGSVLLRHLSGLAAELFTMRMSLLGALAGLVVLVAGYRQLVRWWLPAILLVLSVPLPAVVVGTLALPLQLKASQLGAALLEWRHVPVQLAGNVIHLPGQSLFVTEACSGLRSLTALLALGLLIGGLWLSTGWGRTVLVLFTIPVAVAINGFRVFITGFFVFFVSPDLAEGFMHYTEGWVLFVVAFTLLGGLAWVLTRVESLSRGKQRGRS